MKNLLLNSKIYLYHFVHSLQVLTKSVQENCCTTVVRLYIVNFNVLKLYVLPELGKVNLKSNSDEALSDESPEKK